MSLYDAVHRDISLGRTHHALIEGKAVDWASLLRSREINIEPYGRVIE